MLDEVLDKPLPITSQFLYHEHWRCRLLGVDEHIFSWNISLKTNCFLHIDKRFQVIPINNDVITNSIFMKIFQLLYYFLRKNPNFLRQNLPLLQRNNSFAFDSLRALFKVCLIFGILQSGVIYSILLSYDYRSLEIVLSYTLENTTSWRKLDWQGLYIFDRGKSLARFETVDVGFLFDDE